MIGAPTVRRASRGCWITSSPLRVLLTLWWSMASWCCSRRSSEEHRTSPVCPSFVTCLALLCHVLVTCLSLLCHLFVPALSHVCHMFPPVFCRPVTVLSPGVDTSFGQSSADDTTSAEMSHSKPATTTCVSLATHRSLLTHLISSQMSNL